MKDYIIKTILFSKNLNSRFVLYLTLLVKKYPVISCISKQIYFRRRETNFNDDVFFMGKIFLCLVDGRHEHRFYETIAAFIFFDNRGLQILDLTLLIMKCALNSLIIYVEQLLRLFLLLMASKKYLPVFSLLSGF